MGGLFSALRLGARSLAAHQAAIQITGQNIANANTEGYTRQRVHLSAATPNSLPEGFVGNGVEVQRIERAIDTFVQEQLQREDAKFGSLEEQEVALRRVSSALNELSDADLSSAFDKFFDALQQVASRPEDAAPRRAFVESGKALAQRFQYLSGQFDDIRRDLNSEVSTTVSGINTLATEIADLNQQILRGEFSGPPPREANDLRDQRDLALRNLSELVEIKRFEQTDGTVNVSIDGEYLVVRNTVNSLSTTSSTDRGITILNPVFSSNQSPVVLRGGRLEGLVTARDTKIGGYIDTLNDLAGRFASEFNKVHSVGTGLTGLSSVTATKGLLLTTTTLSGVGLAYPPVHGQFDLHVRNKLSGAVTVTTIPVDLDGIGADTTLTTLSSAIGAAANVSSSIDSNGKLTVSADSSNFDFAFRNDSSGILSALGLNTFFEGTDARTFDVTSLVDGDVGKVAAALSFDVGDNTNALALLAQRDATNFAGGTTALDAQYQGFIGTVSVDAAQTKDLLDNERAIRTRLENEREIVSGVNVDEEVVNLIAYQRAFQGSARFIAVVDDLLDTIVNGL
ncbi:MAG: flagellar hook-associated protein FlgK [Planctomycetes bacterium]|nr:flagellar hook-associated protein FlgK [Planctomycetota bacterium]